MADKSIDDELFEFKQSLLQSRNYYSHLLGRYKSWRMALWCIEAIAGVLVLQSHFSLDSICARFILLLGIALPAVKNINTLPRRINDLTWQYHQAQGICNVIDAESSPSMEFLKKQKELFSKIEERDQPTNQCLMAMCTNEAYLALGINKRYKLSPWERYVGIYCSWVKYDEHAQLIDIRENTDET